MSGSLNKAILIGNLGADPEIATLKSGDRVANLRIATSESWRDKSSGERKERTEWHRVTIFNEHLVDLVEDYAKKGSKLYIEGQIETRKWTDKDDVERYSTEIVLRPFNGAIKLLGDPSDDRTDDRGSRSDRGGRDDRGGRGRGGSDRQSSSRQSTRSDRDDRRRGRHDGDPFDDEIPF